MNRTFVLRACIILLAFNFANCATIIRGSKQNVIILSEPKNATIEVDGANIGQTPYVARLERRSKHLVKISLDGYTPYEITLTQKLNGWIFGNLLLGGLIGIAVDVATGAMFSLRPKDINAEFPVPSNVQNKPAAGLYITAVLKVDPSWQKIGQLERAK